MKISFLNNTMIRIRMAPETEFEPSLTERFAFVRTNWDAVSVRIAEQPAYTIFQADSVGVKVFKEDLRLAFLDGRGNEISGERANRSWNPEGGGCLRFAMAPDEQFFGFGFQRTTMDCRGKTFNTKYANHSKDATIPFFLSTRGYGFLSNNTWEQVFDFETHTKGYDITAVDGQLDFYFIRGAQFPGILDNYIQLTGAPQLIPRWGLGLYYICRYYEEQEGVLNIARSFRKYDIPCDMISLEPGWEDNSYSMDWIWSPERFPDPAGMIQQLNSMGFHFGLWESGKAPHTGYADPTIRNNWYDQRVKTSVDIGVSFFKQDDPYPRMIGTPNPEHVRGGFLDKMESPDFKYSTEGKIWQSRFEKSIRSLANSLYAETAVNEFRRITGKRTFLLFHSYVASFASHRWPTGWAGDYAPGVGMLNAGLAAHSMVSQDMDVYTLKGIHHGYLSPIALIDSWTEYQEPWLFPSYHTAAHRFYSKLRYRLVPYLYSSQAQSHFTGLPMMRPMVLQYQNDPITWKLNQQYMLGDAFLVGLDSSIYLPAGEWIDYWNCERIQSNGQWVARSLKGHEGGPLLVKAGSIIPMQSVASNLYSDQPVLIALDIFPAKEEGQGWYYEDDGNTYGYEKGQYAKTDFNLNTTANGITITAGPRSGEFTNMPQRAYLLKVRNIKNVKSVVFNEQKIDEIPSKESLLYIGGKAGWWYDANRHILLIKPGAAWRLGYDSRGKNGDPDRDSLYLLTGFHTEEKGFLCNIETEFTGEPDLQPKTDTHLKPDRLLVTANPPEQVITLHSLCKYGFYFKKAMIYVEVMHGNNLVDNASNPVLLEVFDEDGKLIRSKEKNATNGKAIFAWEEYLEEKIWFKVSSPGLSPSEITIRKAPALNGNM